GPACTLQAGRGSAVPGGRPRPGAAATLLTGLTTGLTTGLAGVGGGFLVVPALVLLGAPMRAAVGTSLVVIVMNSTAGVGGYLPQVQIPWAVVAVVTAPALLAVLGGGRLATAIRPTSLKRAFAAFLIAVGGLVLAQSRGMEDPEAHAPPTAPRQAAARPAR